MLLSRLAALTLFCFSKGAIGNEHRIKDVEEFSEFVSSVNLGSNDYEETTVYLDSDLSLSEKTSLEPIGKSTSYYFRGVFDGQGHVISDLVISTSSYVFTGLFGFSYGLTIKNVVLDSSCSMTNSYSSSSNVYAGGIISHCYAYYGECIIENSVNMANVTFDGTTSGSYYLYLSGIAGWLYSYSYNNIYVKNCANYGSITHSGTSYKSFIGGIAGDLYNSGSSYIHNCLNYGTITHSGKTSNTLYLGGIAGYSYYTHFENCVSAGKISATGTTSTRYVRSIVGYVYSSKTYINYCYYTSDVDVSNICYGSPSSTTGTPSSPSTVNSTLINNLNDYASNNGWNKWILNANNVALTLKVNDSKGFSVSSSIFVLPNLTSDSGKFVWFTDSSLTESFYSSAVSANTTLYGTICALCYAVTFDPNGGSVAETTKNIVYNSTYGDLPTPTMTGFTSTGWFTEGDELINSTTVLTSKTDHTLYAHWTGNNYTLTLDADGGSGIPVLYAVTFNSTYGNLPTPTRTGYTFSGWFTETPGGTQVTSTTVVGTPSDHTIYAHWEATKYTITFDSKGGSACAAITQDCDSYVKLPTPDRIGYTFVCWCSDSSAESEYTATRMPYTNVTLYARWSANNYVVSFDSKCGVDRSSMVVTYDKAYDISDPERSGYGFIRWDVVGTEDTVKDRNTVVKTASNHMLCAVWDINTVTFDVMGGDGGDLAPVNATYNEGYANLPAPSRTGYKFVGWFTEEGEGVTNGTTVTISYPHTLYAHWEIGSYNVTFDLGYKSIVRTFVYADMIVYPDYPEWEGYKFKGWDRNDVSMPGCNITIKAVWEARQYTVKFDYMNETTVDVECKYNEKIVYPENPEREGYTFDGWNNDAKFMPGYNLTIKAVWTANEYTITFNVTGGNELQMRNMVVTFNSTYGFLPTPTKDGHVFSGWYDEKGEAVTRIKVVLIANDHTLYARWDSNSYFVTFDPNGGDVLAYDKKKVTFGGTYGNFPSPSKTGYTFIGWFSDSGENITGESTVSIPGNHTLQAQWTPNKYTVTLDVNGGDELAKSTMTVTYDDAYGDLPTPTKDGYVFAGWYTEGKELVSSTSIVKTPNNHKLYAEWGSGNCVVTFDVNGGEELAKSTTTVTYNANYRELPMPKKAGYTFSGWLTDGGTNVTEDTIVSISYPHTLHAQWTPNEYTVTLDVNEGNELAENTMTVTFNSSYSSLPIPTKTGYTFIGWFLNDENITSESIVDVPDHHTLQAQWTPNKYTVTLDVNGGDELAKSTMTVTFDSAYGDLPTPTKDGYVFAEWYTEGKGLVSSTSIVKIPNDHKLYAEWGSGNCVVTFDVNGGDELAKSTTTVTYNANYRELPMPKKTGYTFSGWLTDGGTNVTEDTIVSISYPHTLHAQWTPNEYTVTLDVNEGDELAENTMTVTFDGPYNSLPIPTKTGYTFIGWFSDSGVNITSESTVSIPDHHTLHAQWTPNKYTVTLDVNGGDKLAKNEVTITYDDTYGELKTPTKLGYSFAGWFDDENAVVTSKTTVKATADLTLHAHWTANTYTVSFDANGGDENNTVTIIVTFGSPYGNLPTLRNITGRTFTGWTDSLFYGKEITSTTTVSTAANHTLYAVWAANRYTITFVFKDGKKEHSVLDYGDRIIYPNESPSKSFRKFRRWCTKDIGNGGAEACNVTNVPASDLTFTASFDVDSSLIAGTVAAVLAGVFVIVMVLVVLFLVRVIYVNKLRLRYEPVGIELDERTEKESNPVERRIEEQMAAMSISKNAAKKLATPLMNVNRNKALGEILADLEVKCEGRSNTDVVESFRTTSASAAVATALRNNVKLVAAAEYLRLLYTTAREQEEYEEFDELYFGMEDIDEFMDKMDDNLIGFGGIVSGFTSKRKAIQFLMPSDEEDSNNMPSGVLFKVSNGKGYRVGKLDEETDEVLFEMNSVFKVESVREVTRDRFITVNLSFVSPRTDNDMIKI